ncbi:FAD-dependent monooxygenase [Flavobacterium sp. WC2416]|uniref:FAD-dependent monooxygenase n=1 Tax=Flavobacterium sp. WC2416 TaxID=3234141 RepID=A0AB39W6K7_9FLAO
MLPNSISEMTSAAQSNRSAVIVGASLSGLMCGIALAREGVQITIVERADAAPRNGAALQVDSGETDYSAAAKSLRKLASGGLRSVEAWSSVQLRLRHAAQISNRIEIRYNTRVESIHQNKDAAWVVTESGEKISADFLIGADGHRSRVRKHMSKNHQHASFAGYMIWVAILDEKDIPEEFRPAAGASISMPDGIGDFLLGSVIAGADGSTEVGKRRLSWAWYDNTRNGLLRDLGCVGRNVVQHSLNASDIPVQTLKELELQAEQRWPQLWLAATLHSIRSRNLTGIPISEYVPGKLSEGRIALVGDAAHVMTPLTAMGFNASLQDAAALADCAADAMYKNNPVQILEAYESKRLKTVRRLVQSGQPFSRSFGR